MQAVSGKLLEQPQVRCMSKGQDLSSSLAWCCDVSSLNSIFLVLLNKVALPHFHCNTMPTQMNCLSCLASV